MTLNFQSGERSVDLVSLGDDDSRSIVGTAAARAGLTLVEHRLDRPETCVTVRPRGEALLVSAAHIDEAVLMMLAEIRKRVEVRFLLLVPAISCEQRILALSLGVDHVLPDPIDERELVAVLRNATRDARRAEVRAREQERLHRWELDDERWVLIAPNMRETRLTRAEHDVLRHLFAQAGLILPRGDLVTAMNGPAGQGGSRTLDVLLSRLRHKVWDCAHLELPLRSARNAGYVFAGAVGTAGGA